MSEKHPLWCMCEVCCIAMPKACLSLFTTCVLAFLADNLLHAGGTQQGQRVCKHLQDGCGGFCLERVLNLFSAPCGQSVSLGAFRCSMSSASMKGLHIIMWCGGPTACRPLNVCWCALALLARSRVSAPHSFVLLGAVSLPNVWCDVCVCVSNVLVGQPMPKALQCIWQELDWTWADVVLMPPGVCPDHWAVLAAQTKNLCMHHASPVHHPLSCSSSLCLSLFHVHGCLSLSPLTELLAPICTGGAVSSLSCTPNTHVISLWTHALPSLLSWQACLAATHVQRLAGVAVL